MCVGLPMRIVARDGNNAICEGRGQRSHVDLALTGALPDGTWVLTHQGRALREMTAEEAAQTSAALDALEAVLAGGDGLDSFFADLVGREPQLPDHLKEPRS
jgi:hydrogenase expression/formation protein HypC